MGWANGRYKMAEAADNLCLLADISSRAKFRLKCEWLDPESDQECEASHDSVDQLLAHIRLAHTGTSAGAIPPTANNNNCCLWRNCSFTSAQPIEFTCHVLFHGYHNCLKAKGEEYRIDKDLPACKMDPVSIFPKVEDGWQCLWEYNESQMCGGVYYCVKSYYDHVRGHIDAKIDSKCRWKGQ